MRVLLINANRFKQPWPVMPFGLGCVAAAVERAGHAVKLLDLCFSQNPGGDIAVAVAEFEPEAMGVSVRNIDNSAGYGTQFLLEDVRRDVIEPCRQSFAGPIVIGGPSVGINGAEMLGYFGLSLAIRGDGEAAMVELLRRLEGNLPLDGMPGLVRRVAGRLTDDNEPMRVANLDELPLDRVYDHLDTAAYARYGSALQVQTKRGCALNCSYCTYNEIEGRRWRLRDPQRVADDIERLVKKTGIRLVEFTDSTFNYPIEHCKAVLRAVAAKGLNLHLRTMGLNPGAVDEELAELMHAAGFREADLGAESLCETTLRGLNKNYRVADVRKAARLLSEKKIAIMWYLLLGGPGETETTVRETLDAVNAAARPWDLVSIGIGLRVYRGSPIAKRMADEEPERAADGFLRPVAFEPEGIPLDRLKTMVKTEALRRSNYFMFDEDETTPLFVMRAGTWLVKTFAPGQPTWRFFILMRKVQALIGMAALRRTLFAWKQWRKTFRPAPALPLRVAPVSGMRNSGPFTPDRPISGS